MLGINVIMPVARESHMFTRQTRKFHILITIILFSACSPSQTAEHIASAPLVGPVIPVGESEVRDLSPTTEAVSNCGSGGGTVVKHPSMSVVTNYAVEWEVGGTTGVGITIGEGVVPGGVNLSSALEGRYATQFEQGIQQATAWELPAEPDTVVEYTLMWREVWQPGYVEIRLADESVVKANVHYRIGIQSDIVGKRVENCGGEPIATQLYPTTPPQTVETAPIPEQTFMPPNVEAGSLTPNLVINGQAYDKPNPSSLPYCVAQEVHTEGQHIVDYIVVVPEGWVMMWDSWKAQWPNGQYDNNGLLIIRGPWSGTITINTGGSCSGPVEWYDFILQNRQNDYPVSSRSEFTIP
jgi:hypothetical protein